MRVDCPHWIALKAARSIPDVIPADLRSEPRYVHGASEITPADTLNVGLPRRNGR